MEDLVYNKEEGRIYKNGKPYGYVKSGNVSHHTQYRSINIDGNYVYEHRYIWEIHYGKIPENHYIDHIDGNGLNNKIDNLRLANASQNGANRRANLKSGTSKFKGVCVCPDGKWRVSIQKNKIRHHKHGFITEKEAAIYYNKKALQLFGEFARLNIIEDN